MVSAKTGSLRLQAIDFISDTQLCRCHKMRLPFDGGVVLVYEVSGQFEKLLFASHLIWFAAVQVGHHYRAIAHIFSAEWYLRRWKETEN